MQQKAEAHGNEARQPRRKLNVLSTPTMQHYGDSNDQQQPLQQVDVSQFEEDVALQEATLETLTKQLETLEETMQAERTKHVQNKVHLNELRERLPKLQQSVQDNADLVRNVENALRKTLESVKQKMIGATGSTTSTDAERLMAQQNEEKDILSGAGKESGSIGEDIEMMDLSIDRTTHIKEEERSIQEDIEEELLETGGNAMMVQSSDGMMDVDWQQDVETNEEHTYDEEDLSRKDFLSSAPGDQERVKPVPVLNSLMEQRCWSGSLFSSCLFKNPTLLHKIISIQTQEISCQVSWLSRHLKEQDSTVITTSSWDSPQQFVRRRFVLGTCLDPMSLLYQWHSNQKRYPFPWEEEDEKQQMYSDDGTSSDEQQLHHRHASPWWEQFGINESLAQQRGQHDQEQDSTRSYDVNRSTSLDPNAVLCPYDLTGSCMDTSCPYQHLTTRSTSDGNGDLITSRQKVQHVVTSDDDRFIPLPPLRLPKYMRAVPNAPPLMSSLEKQVTAKKGSEDDDENRRSEERGKVKRQHPHSTKTSQAKRFHEAGRERDTKVPVRNAVDKDDMLPDDFVPLPILSETSSYADSTSCDDECESDDDSSDNSACITMNTSNADSTTSPLTSAKPWWWPETSHKFSTIANSGAEADDEAMTYLVFQLSLDDIIQLSGFLRSSEPHGADTESSLMGNEANMKLIRLLGAVVDLVRLCLSSGRTAAASTILSSFARLSRKKTYQGWKVVRPLKLCLSYVNRIVRVASDSDRNSSACETFKCQQSLSLVSEWIFGIYSSCQNNSLEFSDQDESFSDWESVLHSLLVNNEREGSKANEYMKDLEVIIEGSAALSDNILRPSLYRVLDAIFSARYFDDDHLNWIALLRSCSEFGENAAKLLSALSARRGPYCLQGFLESLWSCIDELCRKGKHDAISRKCLCTMLTLFPSLFQSVAELTLESVRGDELLPSKKDYRYRAFLASLDSFLHRLTARLLSLSKSKDQAMRGVVFDGLLVAPIVALSSSLAVELGLHAKAQLRVENAFQRSLEHLGSSTTSGVIYSSLLWSQLVMLRCCFTPLTPLDELRNDRIAALSQRLDEFGVSLSHVSMCGDSSFTCSSGLLTENWNTRFRSLLDAEGRDTHVGNENSLSFRPDSFATFDGTMPLSILLFGTSLKSLDAQQCRLSSVPETIGMFLSQLEVLNLSHNDISHLPNSLCSIVTLRSLIVSHNVLSSLPSNIGSLVNLEVFQASNNRIKDFPSPIILCSKLQVIDVSGNEIQDVPRDLSLRLKDLHTLNIDYSPLINM